MPQETLKTDSIPVCAARALSPPARMIRRRCRARTLSLGLFVIVALGSCRPFFNRQVSGRILEVKGEAQGTINGKTVQLTKGDAAPPSERITSAENSRLDLMLLPGVLIELSGDTEIEIKQLRFSRDGNETIHPVRAREATLRLIRGTLFVSVGQAETDSRLFIKTAAGALTAGSLRTLRIEAKENKMQVMCVRGRATFEPANGGPGMKIDAGYFAEWPAEAAGPQAAAESGPEAQAEVSRILTVEERLLRLASENGSAYIPWRQ